MNRINLNIATETIPNVYKDTKRIPWKEAQRLKKKKREKR